MKLEVEDVRYKDKERKIVCVCGCRFEKADTERDDWNVHSCNEHDDYSNGALIILMLAAMIEETKRRTAEHIKVLKSIQARIKKRK